MAEELDEVQRRLKSARKLLAGKEEARAVLDGSSDYSSSLALGIDISRAAKEIAELELHERRLIDQNTTRAAAVAEAEARVSAEERGFWFRRFHTSLAIAHGGALAAISSKLLDKGTDRLAVAVALIPMTVFAMGMVLAGMIPFALYAQRRRTAGVLANASSILFVVGLIATIGGLTYYAAHP